MCLRTPGPFLNLGVSGGDGRGRIWVGWICGSGFGFCMGMAMGMALGVSLPRNICRFATGGHGGRASRGSAEPSVGDLTHRSSRSISQHQPASTSIAGGLLAPLKSIREHASRGQLHEFSRWGLKATESAGDISYLHHSPARAGTGRSARDRSAISAPHL